MAKTGLGKGLGALLSENVNIEAAPQTQSVIKEINTKATSSSNTNIPSCITVDKNGALWIDPALLKPNPYQPRKEFDSKKLEELCESIRVHQILEPIIIEQISEKEFYIIAGERRTRAAKMLGLTQVPVQLRKFDEQQKLELALIENIQRADLNPIEEATAYYNLIQMGDLSQDEVAKRVGKNRSTVANSIRLLKLPDDMQKALMNGQITSGHARALLMVKTDSDMRILFGKIIGSNLSVREAEELASNYNNGGRAAAKKKDAKKTPPKDPDIQNFEQELRNIFGVKGINFKGSMDKGSIQIDFASRKDFDRIYNVLVNSEFRIKN